MHHYEHVIPVKLSHALIHIHVTILWSSWVAPARCSYALMGASALSEHCGPASTRQPWANPRAHSLCSIIQQILFLLHAPSRIFWATRFRFSSALNLTIFQCEQPTERSLGLAILNGSSAALRLTDFLRGHIPHLKVGCVDSEQLTFLRRTCNCVFFPPSAHVR